MKNTPLATNKLNSFSVHFFFQLYDCTLILIFITPQIQRYMLSNALLHQYPRSIPSLLFLHNFADINYKHQTHNLITETIMEQIH